MHNKHKAAVTSFVYNMNDLLELSHLRCPNTGTGYGVEFDNHDRVVLWDDGTVIDCFVVEKYADEFDLDTPRLGRDVLAAVENHRRSLNP